MSIGWAGLLLLALAPAACSPNSAVANSTIERSPAGMEQVPLTIHAKSGVHKFIVEVPRTPEEQARGMMFRQSLAPDRGMLFPHEPPREASFWMENTLIPLDLIFIRPDGTIARIEANAVPLSRDQIKSGEIVGAVLELAGGRAAELGLAPGDRVEWQR